MDSIKFKFDWGFLRGFLHPQQTARRHTREITKYESYEQSLYKILSWDDPTLTLTSFLALNFLFWIVVALEVKLFGFVFIAVILAMGADWWFEQRHLQPQTTYLDAVDELKNDLTDLVLSLKALRKDSPSSFCFATSCFFLLLSIVARNISGYVLSYLALLGLFFVPLAVKFMPPEYIQSAKGYFKSITAGKSVDENDLIPRETDFVERDPDMESVLTDRTTDSMTGSLLSGLSSMPSHLDNDDAENLLHEEDLMPTEMSDDRSSDTDSFHKGIRFESGHFNGDSSSEDERNYQKDLTFEEATENLAASTSRLLKLATDNVMKMVTAANNTTPQRKDSSSDSEFEIINTDEANHC